MLTDKSPTLRGPTCQGVLGLPLEPCRQAGLAFIPLAADTLGGWHDVAGRQITRLATAQARQVGEAEEVTVRRLRQRLSLLLMKGNSALLVGRVPEEEDPDGQLDYV